MGYCISDRQEQVEILVRLNPLIQLETGQSYAQKLHLKRQTCCSLVEIACLGYGAGALKFERRLMRVESEALKDLVDEALETGDGHYHGDDGVRRVGNSPIACSAGNIEEGRAVEGVS